MTCASNTSTRSLLHRLLTCPVAEYTCYKHPGGGPDRLQIISSYMRGVTGVIGHGTISQNVPKRLGTN